MRRYEAYRRSDLKKERVKKVLSGISPVFDKMAPSDAYVIAVKGLAKLFVGDVVETAATVAAEWGDRPAGGQGLTAPPLQTKHLRVRWWGRACTLVSLWGVGGGCARPLSFFFCGRRWGAWDGCRRRARRSRWWRHHAPRRGGRVSHPRASPLWLRVVLPLAGWLAVPRAAATDATPPPPSIPQEAYRRLRRDGAFPTTDRRGGSFLS